MLFHIEDIVKDNFAPAESPALQKIIMDQMGVIMKSGKVKYSGVYADARGGFFVIDIDSPEELKGLIGPLADIVDITAHPIVPIEALAKLFQDMAK
jgi:hypothetical protein